MARIDSGLGWICDEDYYVYNANTLTGWGTVADSHYYKSFAGGALAAKIRFDDGWNSAVIMSTVENYANITIVPSGSATTYTYMRDGITWYVTIPPYAVKNDGSPSDYPWICYDDPLDGDAGFAQQIGIIVEAVISEANVELVNRIPTVNWVKEYVEEVAGENNSRMVKSSVIGAPVFSESASYDADDIVMKDGELYRCTASHSGAWSASDFTKTSILKIISG